MLRPRLSHLTSLTPVSLPEIRHLVEAFVLYLLALTIKSKFIYSVIEVLFHFCESEYGNILFQGPNIGSCVAIP